MEMDSSLYDKCTREYNEKTKAREIERENANRRWQSLLSEAQALGVDISDLQ